MNQPRRESTESGQGPTRDDGGSIAGGVRTGAPVGSLSYAQASAELDDIVDFFESGDVDVDQLVGRLARATAVIEELDRRLRGIRAQVEELVPRLTTVVAGVDRDDAPAEPDQLEAPETHETATHESAPVPGDGALF